MFFNFRKKCSIIVRREEIITLGYIKLKFANFILERNLSFCGT